MNEFTEQFEIIPGKEHSFSYFLSFLLSSFIFFSSYFYSFIYLGQLYFCTRESERPLQQSTQYLYLNTDHTLQYTPFFADFGPLNIGLTYNFCEQLDTLLTQGSVEKKTVIYYSSTHPHCRSNSAVLICAYMVIFINLLDLFTYFFFLFL